MSDTGQELVPIGSSEIDKPPLPIVLQYLQATDFLSNNIKPNFNGYINILLYQPDMDQPVVNILRLVRNYPDGNTGIQDELHLASEEKFLQINAEKDGKGEYIKYPTEFRPENMEHLKEVLDTFQASVAKDGSKIVVGHATKYVAQKGEWVPDVSSSLSPRSSNLNLNKS